MTNPLKWDYLGHERIHHQTMIQVDDRPQDYSQAKEGVDRTHYASLLVVVMMVVVVVVVCMLLPIHLLSLVVVVPRTIHVVKMKSKMEMEMSSSYLATYRVVDS